MDEQTTAENTAEEKVDTNSEISYRQERQDVL